MAFFVDIHSHVVPSGDDGARDVDDGLALCESAARHGTAVLFGTPHVWPELPLTEAREREVRRAYERIARQTSVELRLGFELTPTPTLLDQDMRRYALEETDVVLIEVPFTGAVDTLLRCCEHIEASGLRAVVAHPERTEAVLDRPGLARELAERWMLQVNATSLLGRHGAEIEALAWGLVDDDLVALVASDGHRMTRPPHLDDAYAAVAARVGETQARSLFDGSAVGVVATTTRRLPSRASARGA